MNCDECDNKVNIYIETKPYCFTCFNLKYDNYIIHVKNKEELKNSTFWPKNTKLFNLRA